MEVRERHLRGGNEVQVPAVDLEEVVLELRQLPGADERGGVGEKQRRHLDVAVLAGVQIEHEVDEGPRQSGAGPAEHGEPGAGQLHAALEVVDAEGRAQVRVGLRVEIECRRIAMPTDLDVVRLAAADRDALVGHIRELEEQRAPGLLHLLEPSLVRVDGRGVGPARRHQCVDGLAVALRPADPGADGLLGVPGLFEQRNERAAFAVEPAYLREDIGQTVAADGELGLDGRGIFTKQGWIEHDGTLYPSVRNRPERRYGSGAGIPRRSAPPSSARSARVRRAHRTDPHPVDLSPSPDRDYHDDGVEAGGCRRDCDHAPR